MFNAINYRQLYKLVTRTILRLCVGLVLLSSTPIAAQEIDAPPSVNSNAELPMEQGQAASTTEAGAVGVEAAGVEPAATPVPIRPATPEHLGPQNGTTSTAISDPPLGIPMLVWQPVAHAVTYELEVSASSSFADPNKVTTYAPAYVPFFDMPDGPYWWRVRACGTGRNNCSEFSEAWTFTRDWSSDGELVPELISPPNTATRSVLLPEDFSWTTIPGADGYLLEVATDPSFASLYYKALTIKPQHTPLTRFANNTYYWRVSPAEATLAGNKNIYSDPSEVYQFTFQWVETPKLLSPAADIDLQYVPRFQWSAAEAANTYILEVSTQPDMSNPILAIETAHTDYTPVKNLGNDQDYYWRVKAKDYKGTFSPYSEIRRYRMKWNFVAVSLPSNDANNPSTKMSYPYLAWTPIPGAERYHVQFDESDYKLPLLDTEFYNVTDASIYKIKDTGVLIDRTYNWRVRGVDAQGNYTPWSNEIYGDFPFRWESETVSPAAVYPPHYFQPDSAELPQYRDPSIAWPLFVWDNGLKCLTENCLPQRPDYYELTVASDILLQDVKFSIRTRGNAAAPTLQHPFTDLADGHVYYWRVRAYEEKGLVDQQLGVDFVWETKIDRRLPLVTSSNAITLMHPHDGFEAVGIPPVLGWQPVTNATRYWVQVSTNPDFDTPGALVDEAVAEFINYVPWQGRLEDMPSGTYWWRVHALNEADQPFGNWSETYHFNLSVDVVTGNRYDFVPPLYPKTLASERIYTDTDTFTDEDTGLLVTVVYTTMYDPIVTLIADSPDVSASPYNIDKLHMITNRVDLTSIDGQELKSVNSQDWVIAFEAPLLSVGTNAEYVIYVDIDHVIGSGGTSDPKGLPLAVNSMYYPEFALYIPRTYTGVVSSQVHYFSWNLAQSLWIPAPSNPTTLAELGGRIWYDPNMETLQLSIPYEKLGLNDVRSTGSLAVFVVSVNPNNDTIEDTTPLQQGGLERPVFVSDMLMPLYPFDTPLSNPLVHYDMPPFRWRMPYFDSTDGYQVQIARDAKFSEIVETWDFAEGRVSSLFTWLPAAFQSTKPFADNESYYLRVRIRHERFTARPSDYDFGPWSPAVRIKLDSRQVHNMSISTGDPAGSTPTFFWERVDGASGYTIQIDNDSNFTTPEVNLPVDGTSYTPQIPLVDGTYNWRVAMRRSKTVLGKWSETQSFVKRTISPVPLSPIGGVEISDQPTFKWTAVLTPTDTPRMAAGKYQLQVADNPQFSKPFTFQTESTTFTPDAGQSLTDGTWYWRVAVIDSKKDVGVYSEVQEFTRNYPKPTLLEPLQGAALQTVTIFKWSDLPGAATYEIQIDDDPAFNTPVGGTITTNSTTFVPTGLMKPGVYHWRVRMIDGDRVEGGYETAFLTIIDTNSTGKVYLPIVIAQ